MTELATEQPEVADTRNARERREHQAARRYSMPKEPSNIANEEFVVLNRRYGK